MRPSPLGKELRRPVNGGDLPDKPLFTAVLRRLQRDWRRRLLLWGLVLAGVGLALAWSGVFNGERLLQGGPALVSMVREMLPPDFARSRFWLRPLVETVAMGISGTAIATALALPLAFGAARNTSPHPGVYCSLRLVLNGTRAIPELILGMVLVAAVGFGKLPGTLALAIHSLGMLGKFFAEAIELSHPGPVEAIRAVGASPLQVIVHGILPQVMPQLVSIALYRWEYNFRAALVLGAVGAGGIGMELISALRILQYQQVSALLLVIWVLVTLADSLSDRLRHWLSAP